VKDETLLQEGASRFGVKLSGSQVGALLSYLDEMLAWNKKINLTAIKDRSEAIEKHLVDSLTVCPLVSWGKNLLDLGSGAGLPGIPLKIVLPELQVVLVDAIQKKILFQRHVCRRQKLSGIESCHGRAEILSSREEMDHAFDVVISRAFSDLRTFIQFALPFLKPGGRIVSMKGPEGEAEYESNRPWLQELGVSCLEIKCLELPFSGAKRTLLVFQEGLVSPRSCGLSAG